MHNRREWNFLNDRMRTILRKQDWFGDRREAEGAKRLSTSYSLR
jgi:hypothetical protein